jgi:hypothetical protein
LSEIEDGFMEKGSDWDAEVKRELFHIMEDEVKYNERVANSRGMDPQGW